MGFGKYIKTAFANRWNLLVFLGRGSGEIATQFQLNDSFGDILTGIILFFIIGCEFFITYKISLRKAGGKEEK